MFTPFRRAWALLAAVLVAAVVATPAAAHTDLLASNPEDGRTLTSPPEQVTLRFGEDLLTAGAQIVAKDDAGARVALGTAEVSGTKVSASWPKTADGGTYTVSWRAVAADGHPLEGTFAFTVEAPDAEPVEQSPTSPAAPVEASPAPAGGESGGGVNLLAPALFVLAIAAVGVFVWRSRAD